ncbi:MAG: AraC family transcriptional regulator [Sphingobacteriaceae bacterium]|nr:MAG: AraC family transcriptional regulator [Sphingobacteriaceae bacterium]
MKYQSQYLSPDIKLSCYEDKSFRTEVMFDHHMLVWFISGETRIVQADASFIFGPGDIFLIPRNQLATIINYPKDGLPHKTVVMHLSTEQLKHFYSKNPPKAILSHAQKIRNFSNHPLLESCLTSLIPYFDLKDGLPENIAALKIEEAINILRVIDRDIDDMLANFDKPGKIDIVSFMERNFMFNMAMEKFGYLTGRSLTTFKRDFKTSFGTTPQKWLTQKRLELAHYQIREQKRRPSDIYAEVGFENLSHFTYAFKKHFNYSPTQLPD